MTLPRTAVTLRWQDVYKRQKVMMACGLKKEGTLRQYGWNNQGICDECIYGMVASDYFEGK